MDPGDFFLDFIDEQTNDVVISVGDSFRIKIPDIDKREFGPFNSFLMTNDSNQRVLIVMDDLVRKAFRVLTNQGMNLEAGDNIIYYELFIKNIGGGPIEIDDIRVTVMKFLPTAQGIAKGMSVLG